LYVGGYDLSGDVGSLSKISGHIATLDMTAINKLAFERVGGIRGGDIDFTAFHDTAAGHEHAALSPLPTTDVSLMFLISTTLGDPAANMVGKQLNYDPTRATSGALTFNVATQSNGYGMEWGRTLTPGLLAAANSLAGDTSTFEGGISTWVASVNCSVAQSSAQAHGGTKSLALTSTASGTMSAAHVTATPNGLGGIAVTAGTVYTVSGWFRSAVSARTCDMQVSWYNSAGTFISTTTGATIVDSTSAWTQATSDHTAPAAAAFAIVLTQVVSTGGASEVHYVDDILFVTSAGASTDDTSSSPFGLQAYLQVTAFTGTDVTVKLQDSADNSSFTNITDGAFAATTTAHTTQRIATSNAATIRRYVRAALTTSAGFTSVSFAVAYVRNPIAGQVF
jgi:hypothetical protein